MRFISINMAETVYRLYVNPFLRDAMRISMHEMLNLMGMMAAQ